jgi:hypothetical protein
LTHYGEIGWLAIPDFDPKGDEADNKYDRDSDSAKDSPNAHRRSSQGLRLGNRF